MDLINNIYFNTLGLTLLHSLWQGILVGTIYFLAKQLFYKRQADFKFRLAICALMAQFLFSISTFLVILETSSATIGLEYALLDQLQLNLNQGSVGIPWLPIIGIAWFVGTVFFLIKLLTGYVQIVGLKKNSTPIVEQWNTLIVELSRKLNIERNIQFLSSTETLVPFTTGYLKPIIIFPIGLLNQLEFKEVEAILAHELAHIKFDDYLWNLFFSFIEAMFYFHPIVWWLSKEINELREERCDQEAIRILDNRFLYAKTLVRMQEHLHDTYQLTLAFSGNKNHFSKRIFKILQKPYPMKRTKRKLLGYLGVGLLATFLLITSVYANQKYPSVSEITSMPDNEETASINMKKDENNSDELTEINLKPKNLKKTNSNLSSPTDTIPNKKQSSTFEYRTDRKRTNIKMRDGKITFLKINGKVIPASEYENYQSEVEAIRDEITIPPVPPAPPAFPTDMVPPPPPPPPAPPVIEFPKFGLFDFDNLQLDFDQFKTNTDSLWVFNFEHSDVIDQDQLDDWLEEISIIQSEKIDQMMELKEVKLNELEIQLEEHMMLIEERIALQEEQVENYINSIIEQQNSEQESLNLKREQLQERIEQKQKLQEERALENLKLLKEKKKANKRKRKMKTK